MRLVMSVPMQNVRETLIAKSQQFSPSGRGQCDQVQMPTPTKYSGDTNCTDLHKLARLTQSRRYTHDCPRNGSRCIRGFFTNVYTRVK